MIKSKKGEGKTYEPVPAGNHMARVYKIIHVGTVEEEYLGEKKLMNKVRIGFELPNETKVFNEEKGEQPLVIDREFTLSMNEKANLRKFVEGIIGVSLKDEEAYAFDIGDLMGKSCLLNVVHKESKNGNTYANIQGASPIPKGMVVPPVVNAPIKLDFDSWNGEVFSKLPDFIKDKIKTSAEYKAKFSDDEQSEIPF